MDTTVIITIDILFQTSTVSIGNHPCNIGASSLANASEANALDKNPASVIPI